MDSAELEKLIQVVTQEVLKKINRINQTQSSKIEKDSSATTSQYILPCGSKYSTAKNNTQNQNHFIDKRLITENDIKDLARQNHTTVSISNHAILTPLAIDAARDLGITILKAQNFESLHTTPASTATGKKLVAVFPAAIAGSAK